MQGQFFTRWNILKSTEGVTVWQLAQKRSASLSLLENLEQQRPTKATQKRSITSLTLPSSPTTSTGAASSLSLSLTMPGALRVGLRKTAPHDVPEYITYRPTMAEFADFPGMIKHLEARNAHHAGIVKIVPPAEWVPRKRGYDADDFPFMINKPLEQKFKLYDEQTPGAYQARSFSQEKMTVVDYKRMAESNRYRPPQGATYDELERKYWKNIAMNPPIYGADVTESITDPEVKELNIAKLDSILNIVAEEDGGGKVYYGVNTPYLYFGMWRATFSWHVEDMDLYAINMVHHGAPKTWYCVPPKYGHMLESLAAKLYPGVAKLCSNFMRHKTCLISPKLLEKHDIPYQKVVQEARNIIITFPYAYHSGFNHGYNIAESTNFAFERWIEYGKRHRACDCTSSRVKIDMGPFVKKFQPEKYEAWMGGYDIAPHPDDPEDVRKEILKRAQDPEKYAREAEEKIKASKSDKILVFVTATGKNLKYNFTKDCWDKAGTRIDDEEEMERFRQWKDKIENSEKFHVYQHIEMKNVRVHVNPDTMKVMAGEMEYLRDILDNQELESVVELINKNQMIKVSEKRVKRAAKKGCSEITAKRYRHAVREDIEVLVHPETLEPVGEVSEKVKNLIGHISLKEMLNTGVFLPMGDKIVKTQDDRSGAANGVKAASAPAAASKRKYKRTVTEFELYKMPGRGAFNPLRVSPLTKKVFGSIPNRVQDLMDTKRMSAKELIDNGFLVKIGKEVPRIKRGAPKVARYHIYLHLESNLTFAIDAETGRTEPNQAAEVKKMLEKEGNSSVKDLIQQKKLIHIGERTIKSSPKKVRQIVPADVADKIFTVHHESNMREVAVRLTDKRIIYKFQVADEKARHSLVNMLKESSFDKLLDSGKLKEQEVKEQRPKQEDLQLLQHYKFNLLTERTFRVEGITEPLKTDPITKDICKEDRDKHADALGGLSYDDLYSKGKVTTMKCIKVGIRDEQVAQLRKVTSNDAVVSIVHGGRPTMLLIDSKHKWPTLLVKNESASASVKERFLTKEISESDIADKTTGENAFSQDELFEIVYDIDNDAGEATTEKSAKRARLDNAEPVVDEEVMDEEEKNEIDQNEDDSYLFDSDSEFYGSEAGDMTAVADNSDDEKSNSDSDSFTDDGDDGDWRFAGKKRKLSRKERKEAKKRRKERRKLEKLRGVRLSNGGRGGRRRPCGDNLGIRIPIENQLTKFIRTTRDEKKESPEFDWNTFLEKAKGLPGVPAGAADFLLPLLKGLTVVELKDPQTALWNDLTPEKMSHVFVDILDDKLPDDSYEGDKKWQLFTNVLKAYITNHKERSLHLRNIFMDLAGVCEDTTDERERVDALERDIRSCFTVLAGLDIIKADPALPGSYKFNGPPNVYSDWLKKSLSEWPEVAAKTCTISLKKEDFSAYPMPKRKSTRRMLGFTEQTRAGYCYGDFKTKVILEKTQDVDRATLSVDQNRSLDNMHRVCKCGTKKVDPSGKIVYYGFKKRHRCRKCDGCKAPKCGECQNCLLPTNKQACVNRVCLFPIIPKCGCFD